MIARDELIAAGGGRESDSVVAARLGVSKSGVKTARERLGVVAARPPGTLTHGKWGSPEHNAWHSMIDRCCRAGSAAFKYYGGRGIRVCDRWRDFAAFLADMGPRPPGTSLDRIDTNGNYAPGNVRWATPREQANNKRTSRVLEHDGVRLTLAQWAARTGLSSKTIEARLARGRSVGAAVTEPPGRGRNSRAKHNSTHARALAEQEVRECER